MHTKGTRTIQQLQASHLEALQQYTMVLRRLTVESKAIAVEEKDRLTLSACSEQIDKDYTESVKKLGTLARSYRPRVRLRRVK